MSLILPPVRALIRRFIASATRYVYFQDVVIEGRHFD